MNKLLLITALLLASCTHVKHDSEQYKHANPSARAACLVYDDGRECSQYMQRGPVRK